MHISVDYILIIYALDLAQVKFGIWIDASRHPLFWAEPGLKNCPADPNTIRHHFELIQVTLLKKLNSPNSTKFTWITWTRPTVTIRKDEEKQK